MLIDKTKKIAEVRVTKNYASSLLIALILSMSNFSCFVITIEGYIAFMHNGSKWVKLARGRSNF